MSKFVLDLIEEIGPGALRSIKKLCIDNKCQFDDFCREVIKGGTYHSELDMIFALINRMATTNLPMPPRKINSIKHNNKVVASEFKSQHLRVYIKIIDPNIIIILGGYKKDQKKDIVKLVKIIKEIEL